MAERAQADHREQEGVPTPMALFDVDNTLIRNYSIFPFAEYLMQRNLFNPDFFTLMLRDQRGADDHKNYHKFAVDVVNHFAKGLNGQLEQSIIQAGQDFCPEYEARYLFAFSRKLVNNLSSKVGPTIAISGAPKEVFGPLARSLGFSDAYLLEIEIFDGRYAGRPKINMAIADEKSKVLADIQKGLKSKASFAFGDSTSDLPMLEAVNNSFVVAETNKNARLIQIGLERGWPIVNESNILEEVEKRIRELKEKGLL